MLINSNPIRIVRRLTCMRRRAYWSECGRNLLSRLTRWGVCRHAKFDLSNETGLEGAGGLLILAAQYFRWTEIQYVSCFCKQAGCAFFLVSQSWSMSKLK